MSMIRTGKISQLQNFLHAFHSRSLSLYFSLYLREVLQANAALEAAIENVKSVFYV